MYTQLHQNGLGGFANAWYWSSSQHDVNYWDAWLQSFRIGVQVDGVKNSLNGSRVRAVRAF